MKLFRFFELIKFSHTVFALPFALIASLLAIRTLELPYLSMETLKMLGWIILAMVGARSGAMGFNRLVDKKWDAMNPRTADRPSATGEISAAVIILMVCLAFGLLVFAASNLNPLAFKLSPVAILIVCFYSLTKRFTHFSHLFLGLAIGSAPVAAWIAITGEISLSSLILGVSVFTWIAGFDILYALQDRDFDRNTGLHSIPVRFGVLNSLRIAKLMHLITIICWLVLAALQHLGWIFILGVAFSTGLLVWEHGLLKEDDLSKLDIAFFNMNAIISVTLLFSFVFDILLF